MLDSYMRGYAVMNKELTAYSLQSEDLETCKRYCHKGNVVVEQIPYVNGIQIRIRFFKPYKWLEYQKSCSQFNIGWLHIQWLKEYTHKCGKVVYRYKVDKE